MSLRYPEDSEKEPPCGECHVELWPENNRAWRLYSLCRNQVLRAGMDGTIVGFDHKAVIETLKLYDEGKDMFEEILMCWNIERELRDNELPNS